MKKTIITIALTAIACQTISSLIYWNDMDEKECSVRAQYDNILKYSEEYIKELEDHIEEDYLLDVISEWDEYSMYYEEKYDLDSRGLIPNKQ